MREEQWTPAAGAGQAVAIQIFHYPRHPEPVDRMVASVRASLDRYTRQFGPYPYPYLRLIETPGREHGGADGSRDDSIRRRILTAEARRPSAGCRSRVRGGRTRRRARVVGHAGRAGGCGGIGAAEHHPRNLLRDAGHRGNARPRAAAHLPAGYRPGIRLHGHAYALRSVAASRHRRFLLLSRGALSRSMRFGNTSERSRSTRHCGNCSRSIDRESLRCRRPWTSIASFRRSRQTHCSTCSTISSR